MHNQYTSECQDIRETLNRVGDKWSLQVIGALADGPKLYGELQRSIAGVSQRMLTLTVRALERDGMVKRVPLESIPVTVRYELSPLGESLSEPVRALAEWIKCNRVEIRHARDRYDTKSASSTHRK